MPSLEFGERTGHIDLIDFDQGVVEGPGAQLDPEKNQYYLPLEGVFVEPENSNDAPIKIERALVGFKQSEPTDQEWELPCVLVIRDDATPSQQRVWSPTLSYRLPAEGATPISVGPDLGWSHYEIKEKEWPYDFTYTIECWSRHRTVAQVLLQMVMVRYPLYGDVTVVDGLGVERTYHTFQEGTADLTEINSLVDRVCGYSVSLRVEGELTLDKVPKVVPGFVGGTQPDPIEPVDPNNPGPDPGGGGLYGDGQPIKRVTAIGRDE